MKNILLFLALTLSLFVLAGCGSDSDNTPTKPDNTKAVLKIKLTGTLPANKAIVLADFTLKLPSNVTVPVTDAVVLSGTFAGGSMIPYTVGAAKLAVHAVNKVEAGVTEVGEVATITLQLANGATPKKEDFSFETVIVADPSGNPISGFSAEVASVTLQ